MDFVKEYRRRAVTARCSVALRRSYEKKKALSGVSALPTAKKGRDGAPSPSAVATVKTPATARVAVAIRGGLGRRLSASNTWRCGKLTAFSWAGRLWSAVDG